MFDYKLSALARGVWVVEGNKVSLRSRVDEPPPPGNHRSATTLPPATQQRTNTRGFSV